MNKHCGSLNPELKTTNFHRSSSNFLAIDPPGIPLYISQHTVEVTIENPTWSLIQKNEPLKFFYGN